MIRRVLALLALLALTACGAANGGGTTAPPKDAIQAAAAALAATPGVHVNILSANVPGDRDGLLSADGVLVRANPATGQLGAFKGTARARISGFVADVGATAIGGKVYATNVPVIGTYTASVSDAGFPDPGQLLDPAHGVGTLLTHTNNLTTAGQARTGPSNNIVVTNYTGTLTSDQLKSILPVATGTFNVTYQITGDGKLYAAIITGPFYANATSTYTITLDQYGTSQTITAP